MVRSCVTGYALRDDLRFGFFPQSLECFIDRRLWLRRSLPRYLWPGGALGFVGFGERLLLALPLRFPFLLPPLGITLGGLAFGDTRQSVPQCQ